jgi:hypothetical protein
MTWPFGGLPLGGVFLGQADGPLLQLARIGGPAAAHRRGLGGRGRVATLGRRGHSARRRGGHRVRRHRRAGRRSSSPGSRSHPRRRRWLPTAGRPGALHHGRGGLVQGGGRRGLDKEEVSPATVFAAQVRGHRPLARVPRRPVAGAVARGRHRPVRPAARLPQAPRWPGWPANCTRPWSPGSPSRRRRPRSATRSWSGAPTAGSWARSRRCTGSPSASTSPTVLHLALRQPVRGPDRCRPRPRHRPAAHAGRPAGHPRLLRGLLRQPQPHLGAGRGRAPHRAHQHVLVRHGAGPDAGGGRRRRAGRRDRARSRAGRPTGYSTVVDQRGQVLQRSVLGRRQVLTATVPLRRGFTPYDHLGDLPVLLAGRRPWLSWPAGSGQPDS